MADEDGNQEKPKQGDYLVYKASQVCWGKSLAGCGCNPESDRTMWVPRGSLTTDEWCTVEGFTGRWYSPITMPRWASRLSLLVKSVKVERVQEISEEDALEEGICFHYPTGDCNVIRHAVCGTRPTLNDPSSAYDVFRKLWDRHNAKHPWDKNPWVWALKVERVG